MCEDGALHIVVRLTAHLSPVGEFGVVYKAHLTRWHGNGEPRMVAVKTLKGAQRKLALNPVERKDLKSLRNYVNY